MRPSLTAICSIAQVLTIKKIFSKPKLIPFSWIDVNMHFKLFSLPLNNMSPSVNCNDVFVDRTTLHVFWNRRIIHSGKLGGQLLSVIMVNRP